MAKSHGKKRRLFFLPIKMGICEKYSQAVVSNLVNINKMNPKETPQLFDQFLWNRRKLTANSQPWWMWECSKIPENFIFKWNSILDRPYQLIIRYLGFKHKKMQNQTAIMFLMLKVAEYVRFWKAVQL